MATSRFVGRAAELAAVDAVLTAVARDRGPAVIEVRGDPGIGKSRFAATVANRARLAGFTVAFGRTGELERAVPYGILVDTFGDLARRIRRASGGIDDLLEPDERDASTAAELELAVTTLTRSRRDGLSADRLEIHQAVRTLLARLATPVPLLAVLDDLHWADDASLSLIAALLRRPPPAAVVLVTVHRPRQSSDTLTAALDHAATMLRRERVELGPLGTAEIAELTGVTAAAARRLLTGSGGNPLVLQAIRRGNFDDDAANQSTQADLPGAVTATVLAEIRSLAVDDVIVARAAAVAGDPFEPAAAAAAAGIIEDETLASIDRLVDADLVRPIAAPRFAFRHPIVRRVIYNASPASWRLAAHRRLAAALAVAGAPAELRAHHVEVTATRGDLTAVDVLTTAANDTLTRAPASAARWSRAALAVLPDTASNRDARIDLHVVDAIASGTSGQLEHSAAALRRLLDDAPDDNLELRARVAGFCGLVDGLLGRFADGRAILVAELDRLESLERRRGVRSAEVAAVAIDLAMGCMFTAEYQAMGRWAERAHRRATELDDAPLTVGALSALGFAAYHLGDIAAAQRCCSEAAALAADVEDAAFVGHLDPLLYLGYLTQNVGPYAEAVRRLDRALRLARRTHQEFIIPAIQASMAIALVDTGRLDDGLQTAEDAHEGSLLLGNRYLQALASAVCSYAFLALGDIDRATESGRRGWALVDHVGPLVAANLGLHLANALLAAGNANEAGEVLDAATGGGDLSPVEAVQHPRYHELWALIAIELGDLDGARLHMSAAEDAVSGITFPRAQMYARRLAAAVALAHGDPVTAASMASAAAEWGERAGMPVDTARARALIARSRQRS